MINLTFLNALRDKLKGGNTKSIHLNALPGRYAQRLDFASLDDIQTGLSSKFLNLLLTKASFEFEITFDLSELTLMPKEEQKKLGVISKRLNSLFYENEDNYKEHGIKTFGFGYPLVIKPSHQDPKKIIKAPLFIWPLEIVKSKKKANTWLILRNKQLNDNGKIIDLDIHSVSLNEVLLAFLKNDENVSIAQINEDLLDDDIIDRSELIKECIKILQSFGNQNLEIEENLISKLQAIPAVTPDAKTLESITNNSPWIYFGGIFGLYRTQKESIVTDIDKIIDRYEEFEFDKLEFEGYNGTSFSAVETDPSQQEILNTLGISQKKIIQGPPGTGKSQSLTALVINALSNNLKCLVVCEKKTALDVIKRNLIKENELLGELAAVIEDINKDRDSIVSIVRDKISIKSQNYFNQVNYETKLLTIESLIAAINIQHNELDKKIFLGKSWSELVGEFLKLEKSKDYKKLDNYLNHKSFLYQGDENELGQIVNNIKLAQKLISQTEVSSNPLSILNNDVYLDENIRATELRLELYSKSIIAELNSLKDALLINVEIYERWVHQHYVDLKKSSIEIKKDLTNNVEFYKNWLYKHYNGYYKDLDDAITEYLVLINDTYKIFGELLYSNTTFSKLKIKLFGILFKKYKKLELNRKALITDIEKIRTILKTYSYISHDFIQYDQNSSLRIYVDDIIDLDDHKERWWAEIDSVINGYLNKFCSENVHSEFKEDVKTIESSFYNKIASLSKDKSFDINLIPDKNHYQKIEVIERVLIQMEDIVKIEQFYTSSISFKTLHYDCTDLKSSIEEIENKFNKNFEYIQSEKILNWNFLPKEDLASKSKEIYNIISEFENVANNLDGFRNYCNWKRFYIPLLEKDKNVILALIQCDFKDWDSSFTCWYHYWLLSRSENNKLPVSNDKLEELIQLKGELRNYQIKNIIYSWAKKQLESVRNAQRIGINPVTLYNKKGSKGERRNSLRTIVKRDFDMFTDFFPVTMLSPSVCSSIIPLQEGVFDIVIFDEASQLRIEDTFPSLLRGKIKVISGDSQQMPPSAYFQGGGVVLDPHDEDEDELESPEDSSEKVNSSLELADSESLLVYAENSNYNPSFLKIHYRSNHPYLIDFSNHAFYGKRLIPMPEKENYRPIKFIAVNGVYEDQGNRNEAMQVVEILSNRIKTLSNGKYPSVGVATFNLYQRNLILEEIANIRQTNPTFDKKMALIGSDFFVKNLENIQGDERDVIIISTTFGRKKDNSFVQKFGPIVQKNGYKLLNVIITRAKQQIYVCTSIPIDFINQYSQLIQQSRNNGRAIFYAYLAYAKAVSDGNEENRQLILNQLYENCEAKTFELENDPIGSESPFEEEVYYRLAEKIGQDRLQQQYKIGGFRIDLIVKSKYSGLPALAIECDGAKYHSSNEAYAWDMFRQVQLEKHGFKFHRIWSTNWWISPEQELKNLTEVIHKYDFDEKKTMENQLLF